MQEDFEAQLRQPGHAPKSLDDLNGRLADWLQTVYHVRTHFTIDPSPQARFQVSAHLIPSLDPTQDLERLFYARLRLDNQLYEVDLSLRGLDIDQAPCVSGLNRPKPTHESTV